MDFVYTLPQIPNREEQENFYEKGNGKFSWMLSKSDDGSLDWPVHKAAYWGNKRDYLQEKPKDDVNPTTVLQFLMLYPSYRNNKERANSRGITPLHLASARGNLEAVRILMESKATTNKEPITSSWYFILLEKLGYEHLKSRFFKNRELY